MKIIFYEKENGRRPVREFLDKLQTNSRAKIDDCLENFKRDGFITTGVVFRQIKGKLWEMKIKTENGGYRIFYITIANETIFLLHCYKKQSQKAPKKELKLANKRMKRVLKILKNR